MSDKKVMAVAGATGAQGGGAARAILADPESGFTVCALTRNPEFPAVKELAELGAQVVRADFYEQPSVREAFEGAYGRALSPTSGRTARRPRRRRRSRSWSGPARPPGCGTSSGRRLHPHTGLQTVSWLFSGGIEHRGSLGSRAQPGPARRTSWPAATASPTRRSPSPTPTSSMASSCGWRCRRSTGKPHATSSTTCPNPCGPTGPRSRSSWVHSPDVPRRCGPAPLLGAEITLEPRATVTLAVDPALEHAPPGGPR